MIKSNSLQPPSKASSAKASRVPEVGGGPRTSIRTSGRDGSISDQFRKGFGIIFPFASGIFLASAKNICFRVSSRFGALRELAITIPSKPILASTGVTPFLAHLSASDFLILLDALVTSGVLAPVPAQKSFIPPPEPVDSTTGVLKSVDFPNLSATAVEKGKTVHDPTILIWSRAKEEVPKNNKGSKKYIERVNISFLP